MRNEFIAIYEWDDSREDPCYFARCSEIIGVTAEGKTMEEAREKLVEVIKSELKARRDKTVRDILFDLPLDATQEVITVKETIALNWVPYLSTG